MQSKIYKHLIYASVLVIGVQTMAFSQQTTPAKEKTTDEKLAQMEAKLQAMQTKLDSMKAREDKLKTITLNGQLFNSRGIEMLSDTNIKTLKINGQAYTTKALKPLKALPPARVYKIAPTQSIPATAPIVVEGYSYSSSGGSGSTTTTRVVQGMTKSLNKTFYSFSDKNLDEKIKSGDVKEKSRSFTKSYSVNSGDKLQINNSFGKVTVNTWNKKEFKVEVEIRGLANEEDDAQKLLDGINIVDSKENGIISFTTKIESQNHQWGTWSNNGKSYINKAIVNYTVYMPSKNSLEIKNRFGAVTLPDFGGKLIINAQYGTFTAKELSHIDNDITTRFTDVNIESIIGSSLNCQYGNGGGGIKIGNANNLKLNALSITADIAKIKNSGDISVRYGDGLKINDLDKNVKTLTLNSSYAPITLSSKNNFDFSVAIRMGGELKYDDDKVKITNKTPEDTKRFSTTKTYTGYSGKNNSDTKVTITNSYKGVQIL
jgi:hypothetical protein